VIVTGNRGAGARAGSCNDLPVTEEQIAIERGDRDPRGFLGEAERQLFFSSAESLETTVVENAMKTLAATA
jgi:hypothetical protein